jgi:putative hydrolase of HD superfamily
MAMIFHRELDLKIDLLKTLELILVHDIVEVIADDVWITDKNKSNEIKQKKDKEEKAAQEIYALLPEYL